MAQRRYAKVINRIELNEQSVLLDCEVIDNTDLNFRGGQYLIIDTGLTTQDGKAVKRAYSILSRDDEQRQFRLAVYQIQNGKGSCHMRHLPIGGEFDFSGPWGREAPEKPLSGNVWVIASETGITSALGVINGKARKLGQINDLKLIWIKSSKAEFIPIQVLRELLPPDFNFEDFVELNLPEQGSLSLKSLAHLPYPDRAYIAGDGNLNRFVGEYLRTQNTTVTLHFEHFFNRVSS